MRYGPARAATTAQRQHVESHRTVGEILLLRKTLVPHQDLGIFLNVDTARDS